MKQPHKMPQAAQGVRQPFTRQARHATQLKPVVAQLKTGVPAQRIRPVAPPVYRPQATPKAMAINVQAKMAGSSQMKSRPLAPSAYRPQPVPKVLQTKLVRHQQSNPAQSSRQIVAQRASVTAIRKARQNTIHNRSAAALVPRIVQRKLVFQPGTEYLDPKSNHIPIAGYRQTLDEAEEMKPVITVIADKPRVGVAAYTPHEGLEGEIRIEPLGQADLKNQTSEYTERLIAMAHETRHGIDDLTKTVKFRRDREERIHSEWRAFATQSAVAIELFNRGQPVRDRYRLEMASYADKRAFTDSRSAMTGVTKSYMIHYGLNQNPSDQDVADFMRRHDDWVEEALALYRRLLPRQVDQQVAQDLRPPGADNTWWTRGLIIIAGAVLAVSIGLLLKKYYGLGQ